MALAGSRANCEPIVYACAVMRAMRCWRIGDALNDLQGYAEFLAGALERLQVRSISDCTK
jgi:hypothetical protein